MNKPKNKTLLIAAAVGVATASAVAVAGLITQKVNNFVATDFTDHDATCLFNHYEAVPETFSTHGSKEFWACCSHPGHFTLEAPKSTHITEMGAFKGDAFDVLTKDDGRFVPSKKDVNFPNSDLLYDCKVNYVVPLNYVPETYTQKAGLFDPNFGDYCQMSNVTNKGEGGQDALWFKVADNKVAINQYKSVVFYTRCDTDLNGCHLRTEDYAVIGENFNLKKDTWTKVVIPVDKTSETLLCKIGLAAWGEHKTPLTWEFTSFYGLK